MIYMIVVLFSKFIVRLFSIIGEIKCNVCVLVSGYIF
jgi:hypothetical protein